jgi:hypothetical protein
MTISQIANDPHAFHQQLARFNTMRIAVAMPDSHWRDSLHTDLRFLLAEGQYLESLRAQVAPMLHAVVKDTAPFVKWFESLAETGPGQQHPLFGWLANQATLPQMRWFLTQEAAGEAGFDDLVAYTQVRLPVQAKLECARNFWDEMGHGKQCKMHGQMLARMVLELDLQPDINTTVWESLALSNTMLGLAMTRRYTYQAIGALGVIELTAPQRARKISRGMRRLGLDEHIRAYFDLHAALDIPHARAWIQEVITPLVEANPDCALFIAEGALMRLVCGERCFNRYCMELHSEQFGLPLHQRRSV